MDNQELRNELLCLGFEAFHIEEALKITQNKEELVNLIFTFQEEGLKPPQANNLSTANLFGGELTSILSGVQRGPGRTAIDVANMSYPMGDDVPDVQYKMVLLVRMDLKMGTGKIAAQTGHAVLGAYQQLGESEEEANFEKIVGRWEECGCPKIILRIESKDELLSLEKAAVSAGINTYVVCDAGRTQVEPGSMTVCAIGPGRADIIDKVTKHLKLLP